MTKSEEMKRFEADMASDKELYEKFCRTVDRIAGEKNVQSDGELFAKAAQELGYNITAADFERLDAQNEEVSPDELENVAGGEWCWKNYGCVSTWHCFEPEDEDKDGHNVWCFTAWHCMAATLHTEGETHGEACWNNYLCLSVNNH